ncbi:MAG TPA: ABC transporter substrate-binding protein [Candidatus Avacidaminococcus intestinavium]|uniref:ABC transporter substrate-binding protein n=1 Tax=Candidatus Avacidaminococcus intestinavium TaxID=2840684 RepID=A0A9D1SL62_9FIRM|nr:ABC transporter substrate-binding protein [Candidatus Avacidaminococcus intestinavium]
MWGNKVSKKLTAAILSGVLAISVAGCGGAKENAKPAGDSGGAKIGVISYLTGGGAAYGKAIRQGFELAQSEINAAGKVKIDLLIEDSKGEKGEAINAMNKLIHKDNVVAILGPTLSGEMFAAGPIANQVGVPTMGTSTTAEGITEMGQFIFRNAIPEYAVIPQVIKATKDKLGLKRVALMYSNNNDQHVSAFKTYEKVLKENGIEIVTIESFADKDTDFSAQLTKIASLKPDAVVVAALYQEGALIMKKARDLGITVPFIGNNGFVSPQLITSAGAAANGLIIGTPWYPEKDSEIVKKFVAAYQAKYNELPDQFAAQAYDAVYLYAAALEKTGNNTDRKQLRDALANIKDIEGVTGNFSFDANRNPDMEINILEVVDGKFVEFKR